jgi:hypothetical protein
MQEIIAQNIEILEIPINHTNKRYYLPLSSRLLNRKIKHIVSFYGEAGNPPEPIPPLPPLPDDRRGIIYTPSGLELIDSLSTLKAYFSLSSTSGLFSKDIPLRSMDVSNPYWTRFNRQIEPNKSYVYFSKVPDGINRAIMLAFIYDTFNSEAVYEPNCVEKVSYHIDTDTPEIISLGRIEKLANRKISRIDISPNLLNYSCFLTLVTKSNHILSDIPFMFFFGRYNPNRLWLDNIISEINFERSFIRISNKALIYGETSIDLNFFYNDQ